MQKEIEKIFVDLIQKSLNLPNNYGTDENGNIIPCVTIKAQNIKLFNTPHIQITVSTSQSNVFANRKEYFETNNDEDIECFLSFRHIEITCRGTLEIRSDCSQPLKEAFLPPAFNLGIANNIDKAINRTDKFLSGKHLSNSYLRNCVSEGREIKEFSKSELSEYATDMVGISFDGLLKRNLGEEMLLTPLFDRAKELKCPAMHILEHKNNIEKVIYEYSLLK